MCFCYSRITNHGRCCINTTSFVCHVAAAMIYRDPYKGEACPGPAGESRSGRAGIRSRLGTWRPVVFRQHNWKVRRSLDGWVNLDFQLNALPTTLTVLQKSEGIVDTRVVEKSASAVLYTAGSSSPASGYTLGSPASGVVYTRRT